MKKVQKTSKLEKLIYLIMTKLVKIFEILIVETRVKHTEFECILIFTNYLYSPFLPSFTRIRNHEIHRHTRTLKQHKNNRVFVHIHKLIFTIGRFILCDVFCPS